MKQCLVCEFNFFNTSGDRFNKGRKS